MAKVYPCNLDASDKDRVKRRPIKCSLGGCAECGFSLKEQERRIKTGTFKTHVIRHSLRDENGKVVETIEREVRTLVFRKAGA